MTPCRFSASVILAINARVLSRSSLKGSGGNESDDSTLARSVQFSVHNMDARQIASQELAEVEKQFQQALQISDEDHRRTTLLKLRDEAEEIHRRLLELSKSERPAG
jgi:hypothetical protein